MNRRAFRIDTVEVVFYLVLAMALLFAINTHTIWQFLTASYTGNGRALTVDYSSVSAPLFKYLNRLSNLTLMLFWAIVGTVAYTLAVWTQTAFVSVFKEAKEADYVRPPSDQTTYWHKTVINNLAVLGVIAGWIISLYVFVQLLMPRFSKMLNLSLSSGKVLNRVGDLVGSIVLTATCLYILFRLSRLLKRSWHSFSE